MREIRTSSLMRGRWPVRGTRRAGVYSTKTTSGMRQLPTVVPGFSRAPAILGKSRNENPPAATDTHETT